MPTICLIPGDGVGQEVIPAAAAVIAAMLPGVRFVEADAGWDCFLRRGTALPDATLAAVATADATLFGATQSPMGGDLTPPTPLPCQGRGEQPSPPLPEPALSSSKGEGPGERSYRSPILALRKHFDLYANLRPTVQWLPGGPAVDLLLVRENTEGLYSGRERRDGDTAIVERVITRRASERIAQVAFEQARRRRISEWRISESANDESANSPFAIRSFAIRSFAIRSFAIRHSPIRSFAHSLVTIVHKANVLKLSDGLFREACLAVAREYPDVQVEEMLVDAAAMWLVKNPSRFDVIVTTNLFGDILSDEAAGLAGGLGMAPSANLGAGRVAVFEPVHGSAPDIAGKGIANPIGAILSAAMLLEHLGEAAAAGQVQAAVRATVTAGIVTPDIGGTATTAEVTQAVCERLPETGCGRRR
jgi:homoisocitrate dehydrogenase